MTLNDFEHIFHGNNSTDRRKHKHDVWVIKNFDFFSFHDNEREHVDEIYA